MITTMKLKDIDAIIDALPADLPYHPLGRGKDTWINNALSMILAASYDVDDADEIKANQLQALDMAFWRAARLILTEIATNGENHGNDL